MSELSLYNIIVNSKTSLVVSTQNRLNNLCRLYYMQILNLSETQNIIGKPYHKRIELFKLILESYMNNIEIDDRIILELAGENNIELSEIKQVLYFETLDEFFEFTVNHKSTCPLRVLYDIAIKMKTVIDNSSDKKFSYTYGRTHIDLPLKPYLTIDKYLKVR